MLQIESWEDRSGGPAGPRSFGYVYFNDGSRVGYSPAVEDSAPVWQPRTNGGGQYREVTHKHLSMALHHLIEVGVLSPDWYTPTGNSH